MLLVLLLTTLSVGILSASHVSLRQATNFEAVHVAQLQSESGLGYLINLLNGAQLPEPNDTTGMLGALATHLGGRLDGGTAMQGSQVVYSPANGQEPNTVRLPLVTMGGTGFFSAAITMPDANNVQMLVTGRSGDVARTVGIYFELHGGQPADFYLPYGIASRGPVRATGNVSMVSTRDPLHASVASGTYSHAQAIEVTGNVGIDGDLFVSNPDGSASVWGNASIGGASGAGIDDHIHIGVGDLDLPRVDTEAFRHLATNVMDSRTRTNGNRTFENLYVPAGLNPTFSGNITLKGIVFIEQPNDVKFAGNCDLTGIVVTEDAGDGNESSCRIRFTGNSEFNPPDQLPDQPQFAGIRDMTGVAFLCPGFGLHMTGNFGTIAGWMAAQKFKFTGNVHGTVHGGIINYGDTEMRLTGNTNLTFDRDEGSEDPTGLVMPAQPPTLILIPESYFEGVQN